MKIETDFILLFSNALFITLFITLILTMHIIYFLCLVTSPKADRCMFRPAPKKQELHHLEHKTYCTWREKRKTGAVMNERLEEPRSRRRHPARGRIKPSTKGILFYKLRLGTEI